jgi:BNR/Asp-box repeat
MSRIEQLFQDAVADAPPTRLTPEKLYEAGRRRRTWFRGGLAALGVAVAAALVGTIVVNPAGSTPSTFDNQNGPIRWAGAGDKNHLFLLSNDCLPSQRANRPEEPLDPRQCPDELHTSADGGRTWQVRPLPSPQADWRITLLGTQTLLVQWGDDPRAPRDRQISTDGGAHWVPFSVDPAPLAAVPAGSRAVGWAIPEVALPGPADMVVAAVDPATGAMRPLAPPPLLRLHVQPAPLEAGVWVTGTDPVTRRPAVSVSQDGGRTWSTHVFAELAPEFDPPTPGPAIVPPPGVSFPPFATTVDGRLVYLTVDSDGASYIFRSTDGGTTWQRADPTGHGGTFGSVGSAGFVTRDGTHMVLGLLAERQAGRGALRRQQGRWTVPRHRRTAAVVARGDLHLGRPRRRVPDPGQLRGVRLRRRRHLARHLLALRSCASVPARTGTDAQDPQQPLTSVTPWLAWKALTRRAAWTVVPAKRG